MNAPQPVLPTTSRRDVARRLRLRRLRRGDGRRVVRGGAALFVVLPHHRLRRHHAGGEARADARCPTASITVRFDSNVARRPAVAASSPSAARSTCRLGEVITVYYRVTNESARVTTGQASYNVSAADRRRLFREDQLLLLHRADAEAGREARHGGRVLRRSGARQGSEQDTSTRLRCPTPSFRCASRIRPVAESTVPKEPDTSDRATTGRVDGDRRAKRRR